MKKFIKNGALALFGIILFIPAILLFFLGTLTDNMEKFNPFIVICVFFGLLFIVISVLSEGSKE